MDEIKFNIIKNNVIKLRNDQLRELRDIINNKIGGIEQKDITLTEEEKELINLICSTTEY